MNSGKNPNSDLIKNPAFTEAQIISIAEMFDISGKIVASRQYGNGHINDTFAIITDDSNPHPKYILQRINHFVFKKPDLVMNNILLVTQTLHKNILAKGGNPIEESLTIIKVKKNSSHYFVAPEGMLGNSKTFWRCYLFISGETFETFPKGEQGNNLAHLVGHAFGMFPLNLNGIETKMLNETIPDFHNGRYRFEKFLEALEVNYQNRRKSCENEIRFVNENQNILSVIPDLLKDGKIPLRVTHNDTKINNIRIGRNGDRFYDKCVLDLDTVMPGTILYDFGDMVRTGFAQALEDEEDLSKVGINFELFNYLARGFLEATGSSLNEHEKNNLLLSAKYLTFIIGLRFLTDYLNGDRYFKTSKPDHNLIRTRTQFKMVNEIEKNKSRLEDILEKLL